MRYIAETITAQPCARLRFSTGHASTQNVNQSAAFQVFDGFVYANGSSLRGISIDNLDFIFRHFKDFVIVGIIRDGNPKDMDLACPDWPAVVHDNALSQRSS